MHRALPAFLLITSHLLVFWPVWSGTDVLLDRDLAYLHYPMKAAAARQWLEGRVPQWDPDTLNGQPLAANPNYGAFYPATIALGGGDPIGAGSRVLAAHHLWMLLGFLLLARRTRAPAHATALGGLVLALSGPLLSTLPYYNLLVGASWAPWLACALTLERRATRVAAGALAVALSILAGSPFAVVAVVATAAAWIALERGRPRLPAFGELVAAAVGGAAAAAVQLVPAALVHSDTLRAVPKPYAESLGYHSVHPLRTLELVVAGMLGNPAGVFEHEFWGVALVDAGGPLFDSVYVGLSVVVLCLLVLGRRHLPLIVAATACIALAWGRHLGLHQLLATAIPPLAHLRYPEKYLLLIPLLLAVTLLRIELPRVTSRPRLATAAAVITLLGLVGIAGGAAFASALPRWSGSELSAAAADEAVHHIRTGFLLAAVWAAAATAAAAAPLADGTRRVALVAVVAADLLTAQVAGGYRIPSERVAGTPRLAEILRGERCGRLYHMALDDVAAVPQASVGSFSELVWASLYPRIGSLYGVSYALDPPVDLMETAAMGRLALAARAGPPDLGTLQALSVTHVLHAEPHPPFEAAATSRTPFGYLSRLEQAPPPLLASDNGRAAASPGRVIPLDAFRWQVDAAAPGALITPVSAAPGWRAVVDGRPVSPTVSAVGTVGVPVGEGPALVELTYRTPGLAAGAAVSCLALAGLGVACLAAAWPSIRRHRRSQSGLK